MPKKKRTGYKRHSIGVVINQEEAEMMKKQLKKLKEITNYTRNDVLKVVCTKLLSDEDFIRFCEVKGGLSK
jgi:hypothetical protein